MAEERDILRLVFDAVYVDLAEGSFTGLDREPPFRLFFVGQDKEKDLTQLCEVGERLYFRGIPSIRSRDG